MAFGISNQLKRSLFRITPGLFNETPVQFAYVYGSVAKDEIHPFSDLDVAVFAEGLNRKMSFDLEMSLSLALDALLDHAIASEIRIINHLPLTIQGEIITTGILIYCRNDAKRVDFETNLRMVYFDFLPTIRKYYRTYLDNSVKGLKNDITSKS